jgi:hypothetical protein
MANKKGEKHHIVPKVYLESFTDVNGEMIKLRIDLPKKPLPTSTNPAKVCYKPNFYRFEHHIPASNGIAFPPNVLERSGFLYENSLKELIELLTTGTRVLPFGKASNLVRILFDIKIRNEYIRNRSLSPDNINRFFGSGLIAFISEEKLINKQGNYRIMDRNRFGKADCSAS